jgi:ubiquitin carboxyl-terminal hydrolase 25
VLTRY